jgi:hypothetical protein
MEVSFMDKIDGRINAQANCTLEAVAYAITNIGLQTNKSLLFRIKEIVAAIKEGDYNNLSELKGIVINNIPESPSSSNNIFMMNAQGCGLDLPLQMFLDELTIMVGESLR